MGERLREAAAHNNSIMALSMADCEQLLSVLDDAPWSLLALRETLLSQCERVVAGECALRRRRITGGLRVRQTRTLMPQGS